jgi:uncharacterized protein YfiM (DUF2279 family)
MRRLFVVAFSVHALTTTPDAWFGADKVKHFFLGAFIQSASFGVVRATAGNKTTALLVSSSVTAASVAAKEIRDRLTGRGTPSVKDAAWGLAGAAAVSPLMLKTK